MTTGTDRAEQWDAIVIGSGPGGLTAASYLAAAGKRVVVLEQHDIAGGNSQVFRRKEYEFDVGLHYIGDCGPGGAIPSILRGLGLDDRVEFLPMDRKGFDNLVFPDLTFRVPAGWDEYLERLIETFPDDRDGIEGVIDVLRSIAGEMPLSYLPGADTPVTDEWAQRPLQDLFDEFGLSPRASTVLDHWSGLYGSGPSDSGCWMHALIINHYMNGAYYPAGGGQVIPARMVQLIEQLGGEIRTLSRVERILVADGAVEGVLLTDGTHLTAPVVVSNADYKRTILEMTDPVHWSADTLERASEAEMSLGMVVVYVVVNRDLVSDLPNANYFVFGDWDLAGGYDELESGATPTRQPFAYLSLASRKDPGNAHLCPPGYTNFQIMTFTPRGYGTWGVEEGPAHGARYRRNDDYRAHKQWYTDRLIDAAEQVLGPFRDDIVHLETASPLTHERYTLSSEGTSYGLRHSPDQSTHHRPAHRTEIGGLYVVGANTVSGHGIAGSMVGGVACAGKILDRALVPEVMMGEVLAEPRTVPPDTPDWDPFVVSRGKALREKRAAGVSARADV